MGSFIGKSRNRSAVIPTKVGIQFFEFQSFPINCLNIECLDSRLRGNDGGAVSVFSGKYPQAKIPLFSQKQKTKNRNLKFVIPAQAGIQCVEFQLFRINFETLIASFPRTYIPSFPRKWESRTQNLKKPFYPISFRWLSGSKGGRALTAASPVFDFPPSRE
ncbi:hypothetical protein [Neisseria meningitidis]|uniref:hypothetical protein n=3 Tax=Neisseria meningitidis TaxID=487 RepID=UPI001BA85B92|nr:hypothetical protein [Neisseria meningitidis]